MLPNIWIFDSYFLMIIIGIIICFSYLFIANKKKIFEEKVIISILINGCASIVVGIVFAILFQNLYFFIESPQDFKFSLSMTFYGGLIGGVGTFLLIYFFVQRKKYGPFLFYKLMPIASSMICIAHGFGRIGCFLSGCCYGIETTSPIGIKFPNTLTKVIPTNLMEAIFLIVLSIVLLLLVIYDKSDFNFSIYMVGYGIWRFIIEFYRGDERGKFIGSLSPSQFFSIVMVIVGIILFVFYFKSRKERENEFKEGNQN